MLGKPPVPGHPTYLNYSRARTYCACRKVQVWVFLMFFLISFTEWKFAKTKNAFTPLKQQHFCLNMEREKVKVKSGSAVHLTLTLTFERS